MNDRTTDIGADTKISIGRFRYSPILASIGRYLITDTGICLTLVLRVLYRNRCTDGGEIWHPVPNFTPIGATYPPCGAKNLKIAL